MNPMKRTRNRWWPFLFVFVLIGSLLRSASVVHAQGDCILNDDGTVITCTGDVNTRKVFWVNVDPISIPMQESWRLVVIGKQADAINQGTLNAEGTSESSELLPVGAFLAGEDNRLVNEEDGKIYSTYLIDNSESSSGSGNVETAFGVWLNSARGSTGTGSDGQPLWNLDNRGVIQASGGAGLVSDASGPDQILPPGEVWYTSGVLSVGHNAAIRNTNTIRSEQSVDGTGEHYRFVGISSYWTLLGSGGSGVDPSANLIANQGEEALIGAEGYKATGVLLKVDPNAEPGEDLVYLQQVENRGGAIRASGQVEAVGVDAVNGYTLVDNQGVIEANAEEENGQAIGVRVTNGSNVRIINGGTGKSEEGGEVDAARSDAPSSGEIIATASNGTAIGILVTHDNGSYDDVIINNARAGSVQATGKEAKGVEILGHNVHFSNASTVQAEGQQAAGVSVAGEGNRLMNEGTIEAKYTAADGVAAAGEGPATGTAGAVLSGTKGHLDNQGTIRALGSGAVGVDMQGQEGTAENAKSIQVEGQRAIGARIAGQENSLVNKQGGEIRAKGQEAVGVLVYLTTTGSPVISAASGEKYALDNAGTIDGEGAGVQVVAEGNPGKLVNSGTITGGSVGIHIVYADGSTPVEVENKAGSLITARKGAAIRTTDGAENGTATGSVSLKNYGTIRGDIDLRSGANHKVESSGVGSSIKGDLLFGSGDDELHILNSGLGTVDGKALEGNIDLGAGDDILTVAGSWLEGIIVMGSGDDTISISAGQIRAGAEAEDDDQGGGADGENLKVLIDLGSGEDTLVVDTQTRIYGFVDGGRSDDGGLEDNWLVLTKEEHAAGGTGQLLGVQNFNTIEIQGGQWEFGQLTVGPGEALKVNGVLTAGVVWLAPNSTLDITKLVVNDVSIYDGFKNYGGFLSGSGTIKGTVEMKGGIVSPGTGEGDIGTLTIDGDYVQGSNATYFVDVLPQKEDEELGQSDRIVITGSGRALFEEGSRIYVRAAKGSYSPENSYRILQGQLHEEMDAERLASLKVETNRPFLKGSLRTGSLILDLKKDFTGPARTPNQKAVGEALSKAPAGALGPLEDALMDITDGNEARDALDQLSGEIYTTYLGVGESSMGQFMRLITRGMDLPVPVEDNKIWADAYSHFSRVDSTRETAHWELQQSGVVFGFGRDTSERSRLGLFGGFNRSWVNMPARRSESTGDGFQLGVYGRYRGTVGSLTGIVAYSQGRHDVERNIRIRDYRTTAKGRVEERALAVAVEGRLHYKVSGFQVEPLLGLTWMDLKQDSLRESSGDEARLRISEASANVFRGTLGVRVGTDPAGTGVWPEFLLAWVNDFHDLPWEVEAELLAVPGHPFTVQGTKLGRSAILAGVSLEGVSANGMTWQLGYRGEFRDNRSVHTGMLSFHFPL